jgi:glyoxylase-like metal-dependent hydrolase (beta-lactamase superfamily II)
MSRIVRGKSVAGVGGRAAEYRMRVFVAAVPPFMKNGYLVACERSPHSVLIDPGDEVDELLSIGRREKLSIEHILLTHAHIDHLTGIAKATSALAAPVWLHADDLFLYDEVVEQGRMFGIPIEPLPAVDRFYEPGTRIAFGDCTVQVLPTPGHSPGGVCLVFRDAASTSPQLFVGDTLFAGSIGRTDLPGGDMETLLASIDRVLFVFPDDTIVHAGHGPATTIGEERHSNPFLI